MRIESYVVKGEPLRVRSAVRRAEPDAFDALAGATSSASSRASPEPMSCGHLSTTHGHAGTAASALLTVQVARNLRAAARRTSGWWPARSTSSACARSWSALTAALFTGMVLALQTAVNMARFGAENYVGPRGGAVHPARAGPGAHRASWWAARSASGITAELGSMKVTEQIDALRALGVNYVKRLIVPRVMAALLVFPLAHRSGRRASALFGGMLIVCPRARHRHVSSTGTPSPTGWCSSDFLIGHRQERWSSARIVDPDRLLQRAQHRRAAPRASGARRPRPSCSCAMGVIISDFFLTKLFLLLFW